MQEILTHASLTVALAMMVAPVAFAQNSQNSNGTPSPAPQVAQQMPAPEPRATPDNDDITRRQVAEMDRFLDGHPEIAEQLRRDPSLINNRGWVAQHPELRDFMQDHPRMADSFRDNPGLFMRDERGYEHSERDNDISRRDIAMMDQFLDKHPEIAEQLRKDPSLVDNRHWVGEHPALKDFLQDHPEMAQAYRSDPNAFMRDEQRYDRNDDHFRGNGFDRDFDRDRDRDDRGRGELTSFGHFLGEHSSMAAELSADPSLANNREYLASHAELNEYLKAHPALGQQLAENPHAVMNSNWVQQNGNFSTTTKPAAPKPKSSPNQ